MATKWTTNDIPDQSGRLALVTGANGGLGLIIARELARAGADVVLACRDTAKGAAAAEDIRRVARDAQPDVQEVDLADLTSVKEFAHRFDRDHDRLDLLINNAGIMATPSRVTPDGFELQFGTNHLGHFALTGLLLRKLLVAPKPRVVAVSSTFHALGRIDFGNLQGERRYQRWLAYGQSKLANVLFAFELDRRARSARTPLRGVVGHPGYAATNLQLAGLGFAPARLAMRASNQLFAQRPDIGALGILRAATMSDLEAGSYVGPTKLFGHRGHPKVGRATKRAYEEETARRLWDVSEVLTGVRFEFAKQEPRAHVA